MKTKDCCFSCIGESLRPKQWTKNLFIFAGILFSQNISNSLLLFKVIFAFFIFCLVSGCIYILNDLSDLKQDRRHPVKSNRPVAAGRLKISHAIITLIILIRCLYNCLRFCAQGCGWYSRHQCGDFFLVFTVPFVLYGIFRYLYLIYQKETGGKPEDVLVTDKPLLIDIILWVITAAIIIYL